MTINNWNDVLLKLNIKGGSIKPITTSELANFESQTGFLLPKSYCEYCTTIGPGRLVSPTNYSICAPGVKSEHYDLVEFNKVMKVIEGVPYEIQPQFARAWLFAVDIGNRLYFWDPLEITRPNVNEYAIYVLSDYESVNRLVDTFWDFINKICMNPRLPDNSEREIELNFEPGE